MVGVGELLLVWMVKSLLSNNKIFYHMANTLFMTTHAKTHTEKTNIYEIFKFFFIYALHLTINTLENIVFYSTI